MPKLNDIDLHTIADDHLLDLIGRGDQTNELPTKYQDRLAAILIRWRKEERV